MNYSARQLTVSTQAQVSVFQKTVNFARKGEEETTGPFALNLKFCENQDEGYTFRPKQ